MEHTCAKCNTSGATKRCSRCKTAFYCSQQCQAQDWANHKAACRAPAAAAAFNVASDSGSKDPTVKLTPYCANCYVENPTKCCGRCGRKYCSQGCQEQDWKKKGHKHYCGRSGELGMDYEIRDSPDKEGLGVFALRPLKMGEIIMAEKPVIDSVSPTLDQNHVQQTVSQLPPSVAAAVQGLHPPGAPVYQKVKTNYITFGPLAGSGGVKSGLLVTMSRVNHDCIGNTTHRYVPAKGVVLLQANHAISAGDELTFSYVPPTGGAGGAGTEPPGGGADRQEQLMQRYGFQCRCKACTDPDIDSKLARISWLLWNVEMTSQLFCFKSIGYAWELISIYDELQCSPQLYSRTYADIFQSMMLVKKPLEECREVAQKENHYAELWYDEFEPELADSRRRLADPLAYFENTPMQHIGERDSVISMVQELQRSGRLSDYARSYP